MILYWWRKKERKRFSPQERCDGRPEPCKRLPTPSQSPVWWHHDEREHDDDEEEDEAEKDDDDVREDEDDEDSYIEDNEVTITRNTLLDFRGNEDYEDYADD